MNLRMVLGWWAAALLVVASAAIAWKDHPQAPGPTPAAAPEAAASHHSGAEHALLTAQDWEWVRRADADGAGEILPDLEAAFSSDPREHGRCHQLVHEIGRRAYRSYGSVQVAGEAGTPWCGDGYLHGVMEGWASANTAAEVASALNEVCGQSPNNACSHGLGHAVSVHAPDLAAAFELCATVDSAPWLCMEGVQMVHLQQMTLDQDQADAADRGFPIDSFCSQMPARFVPQCEYDAGPRWLSAAQSADIGQALGLCASLPTGASGARRCAAGLSTAVYGVAGRDPDAVAAACESGPTNLQESCVEASYEILSRIYEELELGPLCPEVPHRWQPLCAAAEGRSGAARS